MYQAIGSMICCMLFGLVILISYFSKKRVNTVETKIYNILIVLSFCGLIIELLCCYFTANKELFPISVVIINRLWLVHIVSWLFIFTFYIYQISFVNVSQKVAKIAMMLFIFSYILSVLIVCTLPLYYYYENNVVYSYGISTDFIAIIAGGCIISWILSVVLNFKNIQWKKYIPLFSLIGCVFFALVVRIINPGFLVISISLFLVTFIMYFTIENPDVKIIEELKRSREISTSSNTEKSMFLFNITQNIKKPTSEIYDLCSYIDDATSLDEAKEIANDIKLSSRKVMNIINDALDISSIASSKLDVKYNKYNISTIFKQTSKILSSNLVNKDVELNVDISNNIPQNLYGDGLRLKQALSIILNNAVKYTDKGSISYRASFINKGDICRILIVVEDTGCGMSADQVNDVLESASDISEQEFEKIEAHNQHLKLAKTIIDLIGGKLIIDSRLNEGTKITIVLDQKIVPEEGLLNKYSASKRILLVDDNLNEVKSITKILKPKDIELIVSKSGESCLAKVRKGENFDLILMKDDMDKLSGVTTLKKLQALDNFKIPVYVLTKDTSDIEIQGYLKLGFKGFIDLHKNRKDFSSDISNLVK